MDNSDWPEQMLKLLIITCGDLHYATGVLDGLGHPNTYLIEQASELLDRVIDFVTENPEATTRQDKAQ